MDRRYNLSTAADLAAAVYNARPDTAHLSITADWCREQMHALGVTRYEDVDEATITAICERLAELQPEDYHITAIRDGGVYGHLTSGCDEGGCAGDEQFLNGTPADEVEVGHVYAIASDGTVLAEVEGA
jgi:hypothetical protein